jgi:hypothetical protein
MKNELRIVILSAAVFALSACGTSEPVASSPRGRPEPPPRGFFDRLADNLTERECNVIRFSCPYGFGPAEEPCECVDPRGTVLRGRTIK